MSELSNQDLVVAIERLKQDVEKFEVGSDSLEVELESAAKHIPAYIKIVKSHIEQLRSVLLLDNHNNRNLESVNLATPVQQLIAMFKVITDEDINQIEELAEIAKNWVTEAEQNISEATITEKEEA